MADAPDPGWIAGIEPNRQTRAHSSRTQEVHMSTEQGRDGVLEIMVVRTLQHKADDFEQESRPPLPSFREIQEKLDSPEGQSLADFMGHMWEAVDEWCYDVFPQFRYDDRDPIDRYGTPEHEAWLIEMERQEG